MFFVGCANHPTTPPKIPPYEVETRHYRSTERFDHVTVEVRADQRANSWVAGFIELPNAVAKELAVYLGRKDIRVSDHGDDAGAARRSVIRSVLKSLQQNLASFTLESILEEVTRWRREGVSLFGRQRENVRRGLVESGGGRLPTPLPP